MCSDSCNLDTECRVNQNSEHVCTLRVLVTQVGIVSQKVAVVHIVELGFVLLEYFGNVLGVTNLIFFE